MNADWSDAPDWAFAFAQIVYRHPTDSVDFAWIGRDGYNFNYKQGRSCACHSFNDQITLNDFRIVSLRPERITANRNGEDLPPIGCDVVIHDDGGLRYGQGESGKVIAHVEDTAVVRMSYGLGCFEARCLRTPEQAKAEAREKAIDAMVATCPYPGSDSTRIDCAALYDAGWAKFEIVD
ncbi:hypothetical protein HNO91_11930 [Pseudomonas corrugata]|uniref:Uncharacterized protein n=1 Tax=Pseudomonas corrugata TaxID=47879 RepID=A0A7Y5Z5D9_9PSED|nr:hypothetical protein [Pseudomonas corrugata]NUT87136.1 hypothetical protein [Pseudomonas corrugata]